MSPKSLIFSLLKKTETMEGYRMRANFNGNVSSRTSFPSKPPSQISLPISSYLTRRVDDAEISIFDAERYFNEGGGGVNILNKKPVLLNRIAASESCDSSTNPRDSSVSWVDGYGRNWRNRSFRATPTASSEASWNSQSGLLSNPPGSVAVSVRAFPLNEKRKNFSTGRRFFGRNCPCYGKKSVDVEETYAEPKSPVRFSSDKVSTVTGTGIDIDSSATKEVEDVSKLKISAGSWVKNTPLFSPEIGHRIVNSGRQFVESAGFSFPILAPPPPPPPPAMDSSGADDPARDSLEVFRPVEELTILRRSTEFPRRLPAAASGDDDVASDTSSDLFEIESFSTGSVYRRRDSLDEFPKLAGSSAATAGILQFRRSLEETTASITPSECYAPSEVSVEWSVTTAEGGFDRASVAHFSSAASDYEEVRSVQAEHERLGNGGNRKKGTGGLLSCRCENSVNVGPSPVRIGPDQRRAGPVVFAVEPDRGIGMGVSRFALEKAELVRSHSAQMNRPVQTR